MNTLKSFPSFVLGMVLGLILAFLTEVETFFLVTFSVVIGFITAPLIGTATFLGLYLLISMTGGYMLMLTSAIKSKN